MNFVSLLQSFLNSTDTLMQVLATLYVAVAIFAGEQISSTLGKESSPIRLKPMRYVEYLKLKTAALCIPLPIVLAHLQDVDFFPSWHTSPLLKLGLLSLGCIILQTKLLLATFDALLQSQINRKYHNITDSVTRLVAWALDEEDENIEKNKIIVSLMNRNNDYNLETQVVQLLDDSLGDLLKAPNQNKGVIFLGSLRSLRTNLDKRPLDRPQYYERFFKLTHEGWYKATRLRSTLHTHNVYQVSGTLAKTARSLLAVSMGPQGLAYDYLRHLKTFLADSPKKKADYFNRIGDTLLLQISSSSDSSNTWDEYFPEEWKITKETVSTTDDFDVPLILFRQYTRLVNKVQREESDIEARLDDISYHLIPDIHTGLWSDLMTLRYQYWPGTTAEEHLQYWLAHPKKFGFATIGETVDFHIADRQERVMKVFADLEQSTLELVAELLIFSDDELEALIKAASKLLRNRSGLEKDYFASQLEDILDALKQLSHIQAGHKNLDK